MVLYFTPAETYFPTLHFPFCSYTPTFTCPMMSDCIDNSNDTMNLSGEGNDPLVGHSIQD